MAKVFRMTEIYRLSYINVNFKKKKKKSAKNLVRAAGNIEGGFFLRTSKVVEFFIGP